MILQNLFDDEYGVVDELSLQHRVKNSQECLEVCLAISKRYDDGKPLAGDALFRRPMTSTINAVMWDW